MKEGQMMNDKKKYVDQLFKLIRIFVTASSQIGKKESDAKEADAKADKAEDQYQTPKKQIKSVEKTAVSSFDFGEITQASLFGDTDAAPEEEDEVADEKEIKNPIQEKTDKDSTAHLRKALQQNELGSLIIQRADIPCLQDQIIKVVSMFITQEEVSLDDRHIIESAMDLWSTLLRKKNDDQDQQPA